LDKKNYKRIIIVAYRLPFRFVKKKEETHIVQNSGGLVSAILSLSEKINNGASTSEKIIWVGAGEKLPGKETVLPDFVLHPIAIPPEMT
jgi:trehalose 6-phosphate synthase/phosphatase